MQSTMPSWQGLHSSSSGVYWVATERISHTSAEVSLCAPAHPSVVATAGWTTPERELVRGVACAGTQSDRGNLTTLGIPVQEESRMTTHTFRFIAKAWLSVALVGALAACAGTPPPSQQMSLAQAAVDRANTACVPSGEMLTDS